MIDFSHSLATPQAVDDLRDATARLREAIEIDLGQGVGANELARLCHPVLSRPVVLDYVRAVERRAAALACLADVGLSRYVSVHIFGTFGRERRRVVLTLGLDPAELAEDPRSLWSRIVRALMSAGIAAVRDADHVPGTRRRAAAKSLGLNIGGDTTADGDAFADGDEFELVSAGRPTRRSDDQREDAR